MFERSYREIAEEFAVEVAVQVGKTGERIANLAEVVKVFHEKVQEASEGRS